mmetsp:Transcript_39731/g.131506  ORF Transcript_39731/g.131506 Transcript_39731/m.131506 type:complete len:220 (-) Transcript_39731:237-896(-)
MSRCATKSQRSHTPHTATGHTGNTLYSPTDTHRSLGGPRRVTALEAKARPLKKNRPPRQSRRPPHRAAGKSSRARRHARPPSRRARALAVAAARKLGTLAPRPGQPCRLRGSSHGRSGHRGNAPTAARPVPSTLSRSSAGRRAACSLAPSPPPRIWPRPSRSGPPPRAPRRRAPRRGRGWRGGAARPARAACLRAQRAPPPVREAAAALRALRQPPPRR